MPRLPAPHLLLHDFLSADKHAALLSFVTGNESAFQHARAGNNVERTARRCLASGDLGPFRAMFEQRLQAGYMEWIRQLRLSPFTLQKLQMQLAAYADGDFFVYHRDVGPNPALVSYGRMLTGVYYFFREPRQFTGGEIRLYDLGQQAGSDAYTMLAPMQNTMLLFPSWVGHEVLPIQSSSADFGDSRFALNCWLVREPPDAPAGTT